jgi:hypothetical protein
MSAATHPSSFRGAEPAFRSEGRRLIGRVPSGFEAFYRAHLRFRPGRRLRTVEVGERYQAWAVEHGAPAMHAREICRAMRAIGHHHMHSNGMHFADVQLAAVDPALSDNFPPAELSPLDAPDDLVLHIDRVMTDLLALRARVAA